MGSCGNSGYSTASGRLQPDHPPHGGRQGSTFFLDGVGKPLALAVHALLAGNLTFAGGIERSAANLDLTLSLVMADDQAI
jgi:hypothetical protein